MWAITDEAGVGVMIGMVNTAIKLGVYYAHERAWDRMRLCRAE